MSLVLSAPKLVLLAVHLTAKADLDSLSFLAANHGAVLRKELLLRIVLTYLPETLKSEEYVSFIKEIENGEYAAPEHWDVDISAVQDLSEEQALKKVRKLHLQKLSWSDAPVEAEGDLLTLFLLRRAYQVDEEAGLLTQLPDLVAPFLEHSPYLRTWTISVLLPLLRRNYEFYPQDSVPITLAQFEQLSDTEAIDFLLSQTGADDDCSNVARDLRCLVGPWIHNDKRWISTKSNPAQEGDDQDHEHLVCPGWEQVLVWMTTQAGTSWKNAVETIDHWHGPEDADLGGFGHMWMEEEKQSYLERRYAQAALACAYLVPNATTDALTGAYTIALEVTKLLDDPLPSLQTAASNLSPVPDLGSTNIMFAKHVTFLRNNMLEEDNVLTKPTKLATTLLSALVVSAYISTRAGSPMTVRKAGELAILQDEREQKAEFSKLIHTISERGSNTEDKFWIKTRNELLWLRDWGADEDETSLDANEEHSAVFGRLKKEFIEVEVLKALLAHTRYSLAKSLYEDSPEQPLSKETLRSTVYAAAMAAYDNASNPNRTRGGLKKCNDIIYAFPGTIERSLVATQRVEALLKATHGLSDYKLVLKKGEPFTPVVLRVHHDPLSIIQKVLEQNPKSYTQIQDLVDVGRNMIAASLTVKDKSGHPALTAEMEPEQMLNAERRITAMCIDTALTEDDFETAYTYVVNRLAALSGPLQASPRKASSGSLRVNTPVRDDWSWRAALQAGMYQRTARTMRPTHLGTASGNPDIRHLEQRIECLATALRVAPANTLPEILKNYRRTEEALDAAIKAEAEQESAWDDAADRQVMPGTFKTPTPQRESGGRQGTSSKHRATEEAPMSLFDLSRASMLSAQKNFTALSNFNITAQNKSSNAEPDVGEQQQRARKRDQLRNAAVGGLTAGVGWLIGAQPVHKEQEED